MKKFLLIFVAMFLSAPSVAKICMVNDPTIMVTHTQLADQVAALEAKIAALTVDPSGCTFDVYTPKYDEFVKGNIGAAWGVSKSGNTKEDLKCTVTGISMCSDVNGTYAIRGNPSNTHGGHCWCKMTAPRVGAWVYFGINWVGTAPDCAVSCAHHCAFNVQSNSVMHDAVLALP